MLVWLLYAGVAEARTVAPADEAELQRVLTKLGAAAVALDKKLPSFTCMESVVSQEVSGGKVRENVDFTATLRAQRLDNGRLTESFAITSVRGRPFQQGHFRMPAYLQGGFDAAMRYFAPDQQFCYAFTLKGRTVEFATTAQGVRDGCKDEGMRGMATLDSEGEVTHLERTVPAKVSRATLLAQFVSVDFGEVSMNGQIYRLPQHVLAEMPQGRSVGRFEATYSGCRLFQSTATIGPAEIMPEDGTKPKP